MSRVLIVAGTRPEVIKLHPVLLELKKKPGIDVVWASTGQHREMLKDMYAFFNFTADYELDVMTPNQTLAGLTQKLLGSCTMLFGELKPDLVVVQGDTTTACAAAIAAFYLKIKIAHVEAGLRSYDNSAPFPEEANRRMISVLADLHFTPTTTSRVQLLREQAPGKVFKVGNTVIDSLLFAVNKLNISAQKGRYQHFDPMVVPYERMVLITGHRRENFGSGFQAICSALRKAAMKHPNCSFVYPVHLNPMVRGPVMEHLQGIPNVFLIEPVPYDEMVYLMQRSYFLLTDSGGIQEEGPALGKPVLVMRNTTERPEGIKAGCARLVGVKKSEIVKWIDLLLLNQKEHRKMVKKKSPYGDGASGRRIADQVEKSLAKRA